MWDSRRTFLAFRTEQFVLGLVIPTDSSSWRPRPCWSPRSCCRHFARAEGEDTDRLSDIVVTAQRREQSVQDIGTSITAIDGAEIAKLGFDDTKDHH